MKTQTASPEQTVSELLFAAGYSNVSTAKAGVFVRVVGDDAFDAHNAISALLGAQGWQLGEGREFTEVSRVMRRAWHKVRNVYRKGRVRQTIEISTHGREINPDMYSHR